MQGDRIKEIRKNSGLTLEKFGEKLGVGKTAISKLEKGQVNLTDQMAKSICREFDVNETWLRTGKGEMFIEIPEEDVYNRAVASVFKEDDATAIEGLKLYYSLSPEAKKAVRNYILQLADMIREHENKEE